ncbi:MAG: efflux RND transporter periplasmic adaptor subunit [Deltaproteobacteria bacterium]|nr:efflux RND transporter periplasmic adaptor subunit [Deltaproteobacteria bacterium]
MRLQRWIIMFLIASAVVLAIVYGFMPGAVPADVAKVARGVLRVTVEEEGRTRVVERFVVSAPVAGYMRRLKLDVGDPVKKGQTVAELEPLRSAVLDPRSRAAAEAAVRSAAAALKSAQENARASVADAEFAVARLERTRKLYEGGFVPKNTMDQVESEAKRLEAARLAYEASEKTALHELEKARTALGYSAAEGSKDHGRVVAVRAPVKGRVLKVHHESAGVVNPGEPLVDIGDPGRLEVKVEVLSADAVKISPGTTVLFERWGDEGALTGRVRVVEPAGFTKISSLGVEEQRVNVIADITSQAESLQRMGDGFKADARFVIWEGKGVLQVPASSLFRRRDAWAVFVVGNGRAREQKVEVGHSNGLAAEILSGVAEGETVVTRPDDSIRDGTRVTPR